VDYIKDENFEPCTQHPPLVPTDVSSPNFKDWQDDLVYEIKSCGEALQCHECHAVCHKYGNEGKCCFLFPHEVVERSCFHKETNSVFFMCHDPTVNYYNPHILVFSRHNHDIKCILSGKAAKSAMFYITDYITKMDVKTYEMLSLMSKAVARMPDQGSSTIIDSAKTLLHKCLSQFSCQQEIHAQQAVRYLCGKDDTMMSHTTVPMLSSTLFSHVRHTYPNSFRPNILESEATAMDSEPNDDELELCSIHIAVDGHGNLVGNNQVLDYWYHDNDLSNLNFYDFTCCTRLEKRAPKTPLHLGSY
jgi:hypothetical protein